MILIWFDDGHDDDDDEEDEDDNANIISTLQHQFS